MKPFLIFLLSLVSLTTFAQRVDTVAKSGYPASYGCYKPYKYGGVHVVGKTVQRERLNKVRWDTVFYKEAYFSKDVKDTITKHRVLKGLQQQDLVYSNGYTKWDPLYGIYNLKKKLVSYEKIIDTVWSQRPSKPLKSKLKFALKAGVSPNYSNLSNTTITLALNETYTGGYFGNLTNVIIDCNHSTFTGTVTINAFNNVIFKNAHFLNIDGDAIVVQGRHRFYTEDSVTFTNTGWMHNISDNTAYDGTQGSLKMYMTIFQNIVADHSDQFIQGSYAAGYNPVGYMDSTVVRKCTFNNTGSNGTEIRASIWRLGFKNNIIRYTDNNGLNPVLGDVGVVYYSGNGVFDSNFMRGGRGYIVREWHSGLNGVANTTYINNIKLSTETYGGGDWRSDDQAGTWTVLGGIVYVLYNTHANQRDNINYWSSIAVIGEQRGTGGNPIQRVIVTKNLGANITARGKPYIAMTQSNGTWNPADSFDNKYYNLADGIVDTLTGQRLSSAVAGYGSSLVVGNANPVVTISPAGPTTITAPTNTVSYTTTATDADGTIVSYAWTRLSGPANPSFSSLNSANTVVTFSVAGTYVLQLTVTDNSGGQTTTQRTVIYNTSGNTPPVAVISCPAGGCTINPGSITLSGTNSTDNVAVTGYAWSQLSGPSTATLNSPSGSTATFGSLVVGTYVFQLTVSDAAGLTNTTTQNVTVAQGNRPPVAIISNPNPTNLTLPASLTLDASTSNDPDGPGNISIRAWTQVSGPSTATLATPGNATTAVTNLTTGTYVFQFRITDYGALTSTATVTVNVNAVVNQPPSVTITGLSQVPSGTTNVNLTAVASDPDGTIVSILWSKVSGTGGTIVSPNANQTNITGLTPNSSYRYQVVATDDKGATATATKDIAVAASPNQPPTATISGPATGGTNALIALTTTSSDPDGTIVSYAWDLSSGTGVTFGSPNSPNTSVTASVPGTIVVRFTVTDNSGATFVTTKSIVISTANQAPVANISPASPYSITLPNTFTLDGSTSTDDQGVTGYTWAQVGTTPNNANIVSPTNAVTAVNGLVAGQYVFSLTVRDAQGLTNSKQIVVNVAANPAGGGCMCVPRTGRKTIFTLVK